jgi:hypothetical protein
MPLVVLNGPTIAAGESLSSAIDCSAGVVTKITMPTEWSDAVLTFATSTDGVGYNDIFDQHGREVTCNVMGANTAILVRFRVGWVKFRSGTREQPVPQPATRQFAIAIDKGPTAADEGP